MALCFFCFQNPGAFQNKLALAFEVSNATSQGYVPSKWKKSPVEWKDYVVKHGETPWFCCVSCYNEMKNYKFNEKVDTTTTKVNGAASDQAPQDKTNDIKVKDGAGATTLKDIMGPTIKGVIDQKGVCDICSKKMSEREGYLLTTEQVVTTPTYWKKAASTERNSIMAALLGSSVEELINDDHFKSSIASQKTPWMVCNECISIFNVSKNQTREYALKWYDSGGIFVPPGSGPVPLSKLNRMLNQPGSSKLRNTTLRTQLFMHQRLTPSSTYNTCWFCKRSSPISSTSAKVNMYRNVTRTGNRIQWQRHSIEVPRCKTCKSAHDRVERFTGAGAIVGLLAGIGACKSVVATGKNNGYVGIIIVAICGGIGGGIGRAIGNALLPSGIASGSTKEEFPQVKEKKAEGWKIGDKPPGTR